MTATNSDTIWTRAFVLLCVVQFLGYAQHAMLSPALPLYVTQLGGSPFIVGVVLFCFAATSVFIRPAVGHWADRWSEAGVMIAGLLFQGVTIFFCLIPLRRGRDARQRATRHRLGRRSTPAGILCSLAPRRKRGAVQRRVITVASKALPAFFSQPSRSG